MIPWSLLDSALIPGGGELRLLRRGAEFSIRLDGNELMNSRLGGSEEALATLAFARLAGAPSKASPRILIGGLGMGFTLRAVLAALPPDAAIEVAELVPAVIDWARGAMAEVFGDSLADPRVRIITGDVGAAIRAGRLRYDAILLDVDNGPDGLSRTANDALYDAAGLRAAQQALRDGGVLAVWSSGPDPAFTRRLRQAGFAVEELPVRAMGKRGGARHLIWLAVRRGAAA
ncbi:MAG TPA: spermidine synthase [Rhodopseudomonas sp.]|uniref:spermidine synthase n=1 Tax=Rhodopseudomonas sp. TaxID=1078 RepID=UPI002ED92937